MEYNELLQRFLELEKQFKEHRHTGRDSKRVFAFSSQGSLTAKNASTVDGVYDANEQNVIDNNRTRIEEIETALQSIGVLD